jgi:hypothetical protein
MKTEKLNKIIVISILYLLSNIALNAFPGEHASYTCIDFMNSDGTIDPSKVTHGETENSTIASPEITVWGDSLSDYVDNYPYSAWYPIFYGPGTPDGNFGTPYNGDPVLLDSFSDYFTIFGGSTANPFLVENRGVGGHTTTLLLSIIGIDSANPDNPNYSEKLCPKAKASAARSVLMIGGNDNINHRNAGALWLPFLAPQINNNSIRNIRRFIDWNLENGKEVLLEGNIPIYSHPVAAYDSSRVTRTSLCEGGGPQLPPIDPWWLILIPGATEVYKNEVELIIAA